MSPPRRNHTDAPCRFLAYEVSYFSAKVRPALRYEGLWLDERRADIAEILKRTGFGVPAAAARDGRSRGPVARALPLPRRGHPGRWLDDDAVPGHVHRGIDAADRARVDSALSGGGWRDVLEYEPRRRLHRDGSRLVFE